MYEIEKNTFICVQEKALPDHLCDEVVSYFERCEKKLQGQVIDKDGNHVVDKKAKMSLDLDLSGDAGMGSGIDQELYRLVQRSFNTYVDMFGVLTAFSVYDTGYFLTKYFKGEGFYDWHIDAGNDATINRLFSCLIYLNTVEKGGETEFFYQQVRIQPEKGKLVLFPASWTHLHRGAHPESNDKYIMTTFLTHKVSNLMQLRQV